MFPKYFKEDFDVLLKTYRDYSHQHMEFAYVYNHAIEMLNELRDKGFKLGVVTSRFKDSALSVLDEYDLTKYFEIIIGLNDVKEPKPNPEGINKCIEYFGCEKEECLYIGDNLSDYKAAKNAGVFVALVSWAKGRDNSLLEPDILLNSYLDLKKIIN